MVTQFTQNLDDSSFFFKSAIFEKYFRKKFRGDTLLQISEKWPTRGFVVSQIKRTYVADLGCFALGYIIKI